MAHVGSVGSLSVVIPTWRRRRLLRELLFSIARQDVPVPLDVVIADSNSADGTEKMVKAFSRRVMPVRLVQTENVLATKRNVGARAAAGEYLVFLDDDMYLQDPDALLAAAEECSQRGAPVCFRVSYPEQWQGASTYYRAKQLAHDKTNSCPDVLPPFRFVAMAFCMHAGAYRDIGGFCEEFRSYGCEDHDFELSLASAGKQALLSRRAAVLHRENSRSFTTYRLKLVESARLGMPVLLRRWPAALAGTRFRMLESPILGSFAASRLGSVIEPVSRLSAHLLDSFPRRLPAGLLKAAVQLFSALAYLSGVRRRGRSTC